MKHQLLKKQNIHKGLNNPLAITFKTSIRAEEEKPPPPPLPERHDSPKPDIKGIPDKDTIPPPPPPNED